MTRPRALTLEDITDAGRNLGMADLSVAAVAGRLGVTPTALYRHVANRWELERLVGESLLADLRLDLEDSAELEDALLRLALGLHRFAIERPGLADYLLTLFPRGERGIALMHEATQHLRTHGLRADTAVVVSNAVASLAFAMAAGQERRSTAVDQDPGGFAAEMRAATDRFDADLALGPTVDDLPSVTEADFARMLLTVAVRGVVATIGSDPSATDAAAIVTALLRQVEGAETTTVRS
ncbi:TetR/AcrR family transcriptional regulator [Pseudactinotalea sp.]|uniref:TetR/AcrR family transcriptional regulator n=1 Tax=Pseudactinotalea sp. TaxID=1926260 RepID=UPI003B3B8CD6